MSSMKLVRFDRMHEYSTAELGQWVHLLNKRAMHRSNPELRQKDLDDARLYSEALKERLDATEREIKHDAHLEKVYR